jgi:hypothetical protein
MILVEAVEDLKTKFLQNVNVQFSGENVPSEEDIQQLDTVISVHMVKKNTYELKIGENVKELLEYIMKYDIKRFTCEDADLEEIFLQYYK